VGYSPIARAAARRRTRHERKRDQAMWGRCEGSRTLGRLPVGARCCGFGSRPIAATTAAEFHSDAVR
jgi:hypothetical protein